MIRSIGEDGQNDFYVLPFESAEINADRIILPFINFTPLTQGLDRTLANLILNFEDHVAIVGVIKTVDPGLEVIASYNGYGGIFTRNHAILDLLGMRDQTTALGGSIFQLGRVHHKDKASGIFIGTGAG